jgi:hypothetical protein
MKNPIEFYTMSRTPMFAWDFSKLTGSQIQALRDEILYFKTFRTHDIKLQDIEIGGNSITIQTVQGWVNDANIGDFPEEGIIRLISEYFSQLDLDIASYQVISLTDHLGRHCFTVIIHFILCY